MSDRFESVETFLTYVQNQLVAWRISQARLARALGWDRSRINHYLHGRRTPTVPVMVEIDQALSSIIRQRQAIQTPRRRPHA